MSDVLEGVSTKPVKAGRLLILLAPVLFALALGVSVASGLWSAASQQEVTPAPREIAGYHLDQSMSGPEAIAEISELHGKDIDIADGWVAHYQGGGTIWAARAGSEQQAAKLLERMVQGIGDGNSPFQGLQEINFGGVPTYTVTDGRQQHFFYQKGDQVVWVATPRRAEEAFFSAAAEKVSGIGN